MKGVIFGAGSVGRGFIAELFYDAGMEICFIDINNEIIDSINKNHEYPHITVYNEEKSVKWIKNVSAISSLNEDSVENVILDADIIATSLGATVLPVIAPLLARAIQNRLDITNEAIDILLCENLYGVAEYMQTLLLKHVPNDQHSQFTSKVGLVATSIGRMIPIVSNDTKKFHPATVLVEPYKFLPLDGEAMKSNFPIISNMIWDKSISFDYYLDRKLYIHNMGHCFTAYLAEQKNYEFIWQGILDSEIRYFVRSAMIESAIALSRKYHQTISQVITHIDNLLMRFANKALNDTCERVGRDPVRKLKSDDRFLGALKICLDQKTNCKFVSLGVAIGLNKLAKECAFDDENVFAYFKQECPEIFNKEHEFVFDLLESQFKSINNGFDYFDQINLMDESSDSCV